jgi:hypothetical protein
MKKYLFNIVGLFLIGGGVSSVIIGVGLIYTTPKFAEGGKQ